jgi:thiosulfate dehydrogenase
LGWSWGACFEECIEAPQFCPQKNFRASEILSARRHTFSRDVRKTSRRERIFAKARGEILPTRASGKESGGNQSAQCAIQTSEPFGTTGGSSVGRFLSGLIIGLILLPVCVAVYFLGGFAPVAVTDHPFPLEPLIAGGALEARVRREAPKRELSSFTPADLLAGAQGYRRHCAACHGLPGETRNFPEPKMYPPPPQLFTPDGYVTDDPVGVTYWKIKSGIRMTGMPSFESVLKDDDMWQIAAVVASADKLPPDVMELLKQPLFPPPPPPGAKPETPRAPAKPTK